MFTATPNNDDESYDWKESISIAPFVGVTIYGKASGNLIFVEYPTFPLLPVAAWVILNDKVEPGLIFVGFINVELPDGKVNVKKLPKLQSILAVLEAIVKGITMPETEPLNTELPITPNSTAAEDDNIKLPVIVWLPINVLLPVVAYEPVLSDSPSILVFVTPLDDDTDCDKAFILELVAAKSNATDDENDCVYAWKEEVFNLVSKLSSNAPVAAANSAWVTKFVCNDELHASKSSNLKSTEVENVVSI